MLWFHCTKHISNSNGKCWYALKKPQKRMFCRKLGGCNWTFLCWNENIFLFLFRRVSSSNYILVFNSLLLVTSDLFKVSYIKRPKSVAMWNVIWLGKIAYRCELWIFHWCMLVLKRMVVNKWKKSLWGIELLNKCRKCAAKCRKCVWHVHSYTRTLFIIITISLRIHFILVWQVSEE